MHSSCILSPRPRRNGLRFISNFLLKKETFSVIPPFFAKNVALPEYFDVSKHSDTNIVYLEGKLDNTSYKNYVTLIVNNSDGEVAYVGQYKADNVGKYSAKFNLKPGNYTYSVKSGNSDVTEGVTLVEVSAPTYTAELSLTNDNVVNAIADMNGDSVITLLDIIKLLKVIVE